MVLVTPVVDVVVLVVTSDCCMVFVSISSSGVVATVVCSVDIIAPDCSMVFVSMSSTGISVGRDAVSADCSVVVASMFPIVSEVVVACVTLSSDGLVESDVCAVVVVLSVCAVDDAASVVVLVSTGSTVLP